MQKSFLVLVDTSIWIDLLGPRPKQQLSESSITRVVTCLPVIQEVLQGIRSDGVYQIFKDKFLSLPRVGDPLKMETFLHGTDLYRTGRKKGYTIRSPIDCLIAAIAIENQLPIWHQDRDYDLISKFSSLEVVRGL